MEIGNSTHPAFIPRAAEEQLALALNNPKVLFLLGARQVGKTTLIEHILESRQGTLLNMDIEVDRARLRAAAKLSPLEAIRSLGGQEVLVIDEAQRVPTIGQITKGWYDAKVTTKIILLGSASATLLDTAAAELAGRNEKLWLTPLLFSELLHQEPWARAATVDLHRDFTDQLHAMVVPRLVYGSYPEAYLTADPSAYLTNLSSDYLLKDILTSSLVRSPELIRRLLLELASSIGEAVSITQIATRLGTSRQTIERYLALLEAIFVVFPLSAYYTDGVKEVTKSTKYYFWDTGVKNALQREWTVSEHRSDFDQLWENWVIAEIAKRRLTFNRQEDLFFWQSRNGSTVDLLIKAGSRITPLDIQWAPHAPHPSRSFKNSYGLTPQTIHRDNFLEYIS